MLITRAVRQPRGSGPGVNGGLDPRGHGDRPDVAPLADQVGDDPMLLPLLDGLQSESQRLAPTQPAAKQKRDHRVVAQSSEGRGADPVYQASALFCGQPVAEAHAQPPNAFHATNSRMACS